MDQDRTRTFRVLILGEGQCGKTTIQKLIVNSYRKYSLHLDQIDSNFFFSKNQINSSNQSNTPTIGYKIQTIPHGDEKQQIIELIEIGSSYENIHKDIKGILDPELCIPFDGIIYIFNQDDLETLKPLKSILNYFESLNEKYFSKILSEQSRLTRGMNEDDNTISSSSSFGLQNINMRRKVLNNEENRDERVFRKESILLLGNKFNSTVNNLLKDVEVDNTVLPTSTTSDIVSNRRTFISSLFSSKKKNEDLEISKVSLFCKAFLRFPLQIIFYFGWLLFNFLLICLCMSHYIVNSHQAVKFSKKISKSIFDLQQELKCDYFELDAGNSEELSTTQFRLIQNFFDKVLNGQSV
ncbi:hypothetical protein ABK040_015640 [Willaertia magna]